MNWMSRLLITGLWAFLAHAAQAGDISDFAGKAEDTLAKGQEQAAYDQMEAAVEAFWLRSPLIIRTAKFATNIKGYGVYSERDAVFKKNEPLIVYVEPIAFNYKDLGEGQYLANFGIDFKLGNADGEILLGKNDFLNMPIKTARHNREVHLTLTVNLTGLGAGKYVSHYRIRDKNSTKSATFALPFEVIN